MPCLSLPVTMTRPRTRPTKRWTQHVERGGALLGDSLLAPIDKRVSRPDV